MNYCKNANELCCSSTSRKVATALSAIVIIGINIFAIALANSRSEDLRECQGNLMNKTGRLLWAPDVLPAYDDCQGKPCFNECESFSSSEVLLFLTAVSTFTALLAPVGREGVKKVSKKFTEMTVLFRSSNKPPDGQRLIQLDIESPVATYGGTD